MTFWLLKVSTKIQQKEAPIPQCWPPWTAGKSTMPKCVSTNLKCVWHPTMHHLYTTTNLKTTPPFVFHPFSWLAGCWLRFQHRTCRAELREDSSSNSSRICCCSQKSGVLNLSRPRFFGVKRMGWRRKKKLGKPFGTLLD